MSRTIEQRLETVERDLAVLKGEVKTLKPDTNWINAICVSFKGDPEFDEVLRPWQGTPRCGPAQGE